MDSQQFTVGPEGFKEPQKNILIRLLFLFAIVLLVVFGLPVIVSGNSGGFDTSSWLTLLLGLGVIAFTYFTQVKRQKAMLATYKIIVDDESITREMLNTPSITIKKNEVREIVKASNGALSIIGDSKINAIGVSVQLENKDELEKLLAAIKPITVKTSPSLIQKLQWPISILVLGLMFATYYVGDKYIATLCGVLFSVFMTYSFIVIRISKNIDVRTKRLSYFFLIPLVSVAYSVIMKWME